MNCALCIFVLRWIGSEPIAEFVLNYQRHALTFSSAFMPRKDLVIRGQHLPKLIRIGEVLNLLLVLCLISLRAMLLILHSACLAKFACWMIGRMCELVVRWYRVVLLKLLLFLSLG